MTLPVWSTACVDWEERIVAGRTMTPVGPLFPDEAAYAMDVFNSLRMVDADGSPLMGEACLPWVTEMVAALFGAYDPESRRRLIRNVFFMVSKKNGKSMVAAGVMFTALIINERPSAEFLILAPTKEGADNAYKPIRDFIKADPELEARFLEQHHIRTVTDRLSGSTLKVVAADSDTVTGKKATGVFIDELWAFGKKPKAAQMLLEATGGLASRPEGFVFYATTQSDEPPAGVFKTKLDYARKVRDGKVKDPTFLPIIYEFPQAMLDAGEHRDLKNAYVTNPNWNVSVDEQVIQQKYQEAIEAGEAEVRDFLAKHMDVEIGMALRSDRWAGADYWESSVCDCNTIDELIERSEVISVGVDGGGLDDLLGLSALGRETKTGRWLAWGRGFAHPSVLERRKEIVTQLQNFAKDGHLTLVQKIGEDVAEVCDVCEKIYESGLLDKIGVDPVGIGAIFDGLVARGIPEVKIVGISQGYKLNGAIKTTERKLAEGTLVHADQPLMTWCVSNARIIMTANGILVTKQASGAGKIDPVMALFNAVSLMALNPPAAHRKHQMFFL